MMLIGLLTAGSVLHWDREMKGDKEKKGDKENEESTDCGVKEIFHGFVFIIRIKITRFDIVNDQF